MTKSRREFLQLGALAGVAVGPLAVAIAAGATPPAKYGRLTIDGHRAHKATTGETLHVYLDGQDVTKNSSEADDVEGSVTVWCRDPDWHRALMNRGALHVGDHGHGCQLLVRGHVVIAPGAEL